MTRRKFSLHDNSSKQHASPKATYTYDGLERLAICTLTNQTPSGTTHFIHMLGGGGAFDELAPGLGEQFGGLGNRIIGETDGAGNRSREYVWLDDLIIAVVSDADTASPQIWWVTNDHLGRPVQMTDGSKTVVWRASHRPFGEVTAVTGTASLDARFPGQWFQLESGLAYNWHRHYDASISRYTQPERDRADGRIGARFCPRNRQQAIPHMVNAIPPAVTLPYLCSSTLRFEAGPGPWGPVVL